MACPRRHPRAPRCLCWPGRRPPSRASPPPRGPSSHRRRRWQAGCAAHRATEETATLSGSQGRS
eukprot:8419047-Heterocapsa_arctica.AAC.1